MTYIPYNETPDGLSIVVKGRSRVIPHDHMNYANIKKAVFAGDIEEVCRLIDIISFVAKITDGRVLISADEVRYKLDDGSSVSVPKYLATRILNNIRNNEPISAICRMTEKLMENPNKDVIDDLFRWVEVGNMPIHEDGDIVAFKKVQMDYYSYHSGNNGKILQNVGAIVEMPREECDASRFNTCSTGLHFCSYDYLPHFYGTLGRVIIVKINPKDVTAIPTDYNHTKGRCCRFEVIDEVPEDEAKQFFSDLVYHKKSNDYSLRDDEEELLDDEFDEDEIEELGEAKAAPKTNKTINGGFSTSDGRTFTEQEIIEALSTHTMTRASEILMVARSTLAGWKKRLIAAGKLAGE